MTPGFSTPTVFGKDTTFFPDVALSFLTVGRDLVPTTQEVIANGTLPGTRSFWDVIVQPGRVWRQRKDRGWSRASFPFALLNRLEGETHHGLATFVYRGARVSHVRFQVVAQTAPFYVADAFNAWGTISAAYARGGIPDLAQRARRHRAAVAGRLPVAAFDELETAVRPDLLAAFDNTADDSLVLQRALVHRGVLYRSACTAHAGPLPFCDGLRFGTWSVSKSAMLNVATLRLAAKFGAGLLDERVADHVPAFRRPGWDDVTFLDLANMASGHGATAEDPACYLCDYDRWYLAPSRAEKLAQALDYPRAWTPGTTYNYRDQDAFLLGVALEEYLREKEGPDASLSAMLEREVYRPIGIATAPAIRTVEADGSPGHPMVVYGFLPTLDDLAKIGLLFTHHGAWRGRQILHRQLVDTLLPKRTPPPRALPKGEEGPFGPTLYHLNWHIEPFEASEGCEVHLPKMQGWGGNLVTLMSRHTVGIRIAGASSPPEGFQSAVGQARVAEQLVPFCRE